MHHMKMCLVSLLRHPGQLLHVNWDLDMRCKTNVFAFAAERKHSLSSDHTDTSAVQTQVVLENLEITWQRNLHLKKFAHANLGSLV